MNLRIFATAILLTMASPVTAALAQKGDGQAFLGPPGLPAKAFPKPSRPVAEIISPIFDTEANRDGAKETEQVFALMNLKPGMSVADIGAGSGYYTVRLAKLLGPDGRVLAQDVMPNYLRDLNERIFKAEAADRHRLARRATRSAPAGEFDRCRRPRPHVSRDRAALRVPA